MQSNDNRGPLGVRLIGWFKVISACLLVALGVGVFREVHSDLSVEAGNLVAALKLDPDNRYVHRAIEFVSGINPRQVRWIGVGTLVYALLYGVEGVGLLLRKHWAEYFTVFATGSLIPLEIWEVYRKATPIKGAILAINLAIVGYLIVQLRRQRAADAPKPAGGAASSS